MSNKNTRAQQADSRFAIPMLLLALFVFPIAAVAQAPVRLSDQQVRKLLDDVYDARDKFEGNLDDSVKNSTMKTGTTDAKVQAVLQDLQDNAAKLRDRFKPDYPAGAEVETLLKQANMINAAMERADITKGRSQWDQLAATLKSLASVYGTTFPLPDGASVRRMNDRETAAAAKTAAGAADEIRKQIDKNKMLAKPDKDAGKETAAALAKAADSLKSKIADGKPATGEVKQVFDLTSKLRDFLAAHSMPSAAAASSTLNGAIAQLQQSFMTPTPSSTTMDE